MAKANSTRKTTSAPSAADSNSNTRATITIDPVTGKVLTEADVRRGGAIDCLLALRDLVKSAETAGDESNMPEGYHDKQLVDSEMFAADLGPIPPRLEGIIIAMAEYIHFGTTTGWPDLDRWVPDSAMTAAERQAMIERMNADQAAADIKLGTLPAEGTTTAPEVDPANDAAGHALDIKSLAMAGKALFEAEDDGNMSDLGRLLGVIAERADELYADLETEGGAA